MVIFGSNTSENSPNMIKVDEQDHYNEDWVPPFQFRDGVCIKTNEKFSDYYELHEEIGEGKFGKVYRCIEKNTGLVLAAKCIRLKKDADLQKVEKEVNIMTQMKHKCIAQIYDAFATSTNNDVILIMEIVQGGELFDRVVDENYILTEMAVAMIVHQICEAIRYIHLQNIIHLDLKPENIMCVSQTGNQIKLIDFGLAQYYDGQSDLLFMAGTPEFAAPEVIKYEPLDFQTDMWSVGVITLSGQSPFLGENVAHTYCNVERGKWQFCEEFRENCITPEAHDFISQLLIVDKSQRMLPDECLRHPWITLFRERSRNTNLHAERPLDVGKLRSYVRNKRFRRLVFGVLFVNTIIRMMSTLKKSEHGTRYVKDMLNAANKKDGSSSTNNDQSSTAELSIKAFFSNHEQENCSNKETLTCGLLEGKCPNKSDDLHRKNLLTDSEKSSGDSCDTVSHTRLAVTSTEIKGSCSGEKVNMDETIVPRVWKSKRVNSKNRKASSTEQAPEKRTKKSTLLTNTSDGNNQICMKEKLQPETSKSNQKELQKNSEHKDNVAKQIPNGLKMIDVDMGLLENKTDENMFQYVVAENIAQDDEHIKKQNIFSTMSNKNKDNKNVKTSSSNELSDTRQQILSATKVSLPSNTDNSKPTTAKLHSPRLMESTDKTESTEEIELPNVYRTNLQKNLPDDIKSAKRQNDKQNDEQRLQRSWSSKEINTQSSNDTEDPHEMTKKTIEVASKLSGANLKNKKTENFNNDALKCAAVDGTSNKATDDTNKSTGKSSEVIRKKRAPIYKKSITNVRLIAEQRSKPKANILQRKSEAEDLLQQTATRTWCDVQHDNKTEKSNDATSKLDCQTDNVKAIKKRVQVIRKNSKKLNSSDNFSLTERSDEPKIEDSDNYEETKPSNRTKKVTIKATKKVLKKTSFEKRDLAISLTNVIPASTATAAKLDSKFKDVTFSNEILHSEPTTFGKRSNEKDKTSTTDGKTSLTEQERPKSKNDLSKKSDNDKNLLLKSQPNQVVENQRRDSGYSFEYDAFDFSALRLKLQQRVMGIKDESNWTAEAENRHKSELRVKLHDTNAIKQTRDKWLNMDRANNNFMK